MDRIGFVYQAVFFLTELAKKDAEHHESNSSCETLLQNYEEECFAWPFHARFLLHLHQDGLVL